MVTGHRFRKREIVIICILFSSILICSSIIVANFVTIKKGVVEDQIPFTKRDYTVLITGTSEDTSFLNQVSEGASIVSNFYDCAILYYEPDAYSKENNIQSVLDYAGFINADCVITYIGEDSVTISPPQNCNYEKIPLITVGHYLPEIQSTSHIGINYAELGFAMGEEAVKYLNGVGSVFILNTSDVNDSYTNNLLMNLENRLKGEQRIKVMTFSPDKNQDYALEDDVRQQVASAGKIDLMITISEQSTVLAVQTISDLNLNLRTQIIGFGDGKESLNYLEKGLITKLFTPDAVDIGKKAIQQFVEYKTNGSANNYLTAQFMLMEQEKKHE